MMDNKVSIKGCEELIEHLVEYTKKEWTGKQGYWTDDEAFKYCKDIYTGDFWNKKKLKKVA